MPITCRIHDPFHRKPGLSLALPQLSLQGALLLNAAQQLSSTREMQEGGAPAACQRLIKRRRAYRDSDDFRLRIYFITAALLLLKAFQYCTITSMRDCRLCPANRPQCHTLKRVRLCCARAITEIEQLPSSKHVSVTRQDFEARPDDHRPQ